jgi:hypothetical protein
MNLDTTDYLSFVVKKNDIFDGRIVLPEGQDLSFVRSNGDRSTKRCDCHKHVLMINSRESFTEGSIREKSCMIFLLIVGQTVPLVVHYYLADISYTNIISIDLLIRVWVHNIKIGVYYQ